MLERLRGDAIDLEGFTEAVSAGSVMASLAVSPAVERIQRWHMPRAPGAAVLLTAVVCGLGPMPHSLSDDVCTDIERGGIDVVLFERRAVAGESIPQDGGS